MLPLTGSDRPKSPLRNTVTLRVPVAVLIACMFALGMLLCLSTPWSGAADGTLANASVRVLRGMGEPADPNNNSPYDIAMRSLPDVRYVLFPCMYTHQVRRAPWPVTPGGCAKFCMRRQGFGLRCGRPVWKLDSPGSDSHAIQKRLDLFLLTVPSDLPTILRLCKPFCCRESIVDSRPHPPKRDAQGNRRANGVLISLVRSSEIDDLCKVCAPPYT